MECAGDWGLGSRKQELETTIGCQYIVILHVQP